MIGAYMPSSNKPIVKLGKTDGFRYIAFKPPLSTAEQKMIMDNVYTLTGVHANVIDVEDPAEQACTMVQFDMQFTPGLRHPEQLNRIAGWLASSLRPAHRSVSLNTVVSMGWGNSSPFNPNPEQ
jgi:hypothetical protein